MSDIQQLINRIFYNKCTESELAGIIDEYSDNYRIKFLAVQSFNCPLAKGLDILSSLYTIDLIRLVKNKRSNPKFRKRAEQEFLIRYQRLPAGEKISCMKFAPPEILVHFSKEQDLRIIDAILKNPYCTEQVVLLFINIKEEKVTFYEALSGSVWVNRPQIAGAVSRDKYANVRILNEVAPALTYKEKRKMLLSDSVHDSVKRNIKRMLESDERD